MNKQPLFLSAVTAQINAFLTGLQRRHLHRPYPRPPWNHPLIQIRTKTYCIDRSIIEFNNVADLSRRQLCCTTSWGMKGWIRTSLRFENWRAPFTSDGMRSMNRTTGSVYYVVIRGRICGRSSRRPSRLEIRSNTRWCGSWNKESPFWKSCCQHM